MAKLPFSKAHDPFKEKINGNYGYFYTDKSNKLGYVLASIPIDDLSLIKTATEVLDISQISFDELIQRDIDRDRVTRIVDRYLDAGHNRAVFFPPLLVSLVPMEQGKIIDGFTEASESLEDGWISKIWDKDAFRIQLPVADQDTGIYADYEKESHPVYSYGCELGVNPHKVQLIAIDGQHRLSALRHLADNSEKRHVVENIKVPICIVFAPNPGLVEGSTEKVSLNLRDLFVTINTTGKQVSGHFLTLLKDDSMSAMAVRDLADQWKSESVVGSNALHFIEWNQRESKFAHQVTRAYAITNVSIVGECLKDYLFGEKKGGLTRDILNLDPVKSNVEWKDGLTPIEDISENNFDQEQSAVLRDRINKFVTPSLTELFRSSYPYVLKQEAFANAYAWLNEQVQRGVDGSSGFRDVVLREYRAPYKLDPPAVLEIGNEFESKCEINESWAVFFLNVFQQGYIRAWLELSAAGLDYNVDPADFAKAFVRSANEFIFDSKKDIFGVSRLYTKRILYNGENVILTLTARENWKNLILLCLRNRKMKGALVSELTDDIGQREQLIEVIDSIAQRAWQRYTDQLFDGFRKDIEKNWQDKGYEEQRRRNLQKAWEEMHREEGDPANFENEVNKIAKEDWLRAVERLNNLVAV